MSGKRSLACSNSAPVLRQPTPRPGSPAWWRTTATSRTSGRPRRKGLSRRAAGTAMPTLFATGCQPAMPYAGRLDARLRWRARGILKGMHHAETRCNDRGADPHSRQDKLEIIEDEGILHEVNNFPCCLQEKYPCSCP